MHFVLSRKGAFRVAWKLFWMATGTERVGLRIDASGLEIVGNDLIKE